MKIALVGLNLDDPRIASIVGRARRLASESDVCRLLVGAIIAFALELGDKAPGTLSEAGQMLIDAAGIAERSINRKDKES